MVDSWKVCWLIKPHLLGFLDARSMRPHNSVWNIGSPPKFDEVNKKVFVPLYALCTAQKCFSERKFDTLPALNLACSYRILWSRAILIWFRITQQNTLLSNASKVIPRDLSQTESPLSLVFSLSNPSSNLLIFLLDLWLWLRDKGLQQMLESKTFSKP